MSDNTWEQAIDLVKFIGKRGGYMNFRARKDEKNEKVICGFLRIFKNEYNYYL